MTTTHQRAQAEAQFKKRERQASEGAKAKAEHDARVDAADAKTARLKALRLEKESGDLKAAAEDPKSAKASKKPAS